MIDDIKKAMTRLDDTMEGGEVQKTYTDYQAETFGHCKAVPKLVQELVLKSSSAPSELAAVSRELVTVYSGLVNSTRGSLATIDSENVSL